MLTATPAPTCLAKRKARVPGSTPERTPKSRCTPGIATRTSHVNAICNASMPIVPRNARDADAPSLSAAARKATVGSGSVARVVSIFSSLVNHLSIFMFHSVPSCIRISSTGSAGGGASWPQHRSYWHLSPLSPLPPPLPVTACAASAKSLMTRQRGNGPPPATLFASARFSWRMQPSSSSSEVHSKRALISRVHASADLLNRKRSGVSSGRGPARPAARPTASAMPREETASECPIWSAPEIEKHCSTMRRSSARGDSAGNGSAAAVAMSSVELTPSVWTRPQASRSAPEAPRRRQSSCCARSTPACNASDASHHEGSGKCGPLPCRGSRHALSVARRTSHAIARLRDRSHS